MNELKISASIDKLEIMIEFILDSIKNIETDKKQFGKLRLVSEEVLVNVINYAYPAKIGEILIKTDVSPEKELTIQIIDSGIPFNPLEKDDPNINLPMEERKIGGLGIFMVKNIMDSINYEYTDNKNILTLVKKL